jgi:hypothetical protein
MVIAYPTVSTTYDLKSEIDAGNNEMLEEELSDLRANEEPSGCLGSSSGQ